MQRKTRHVGAQPVEHQVTVGCCAAELLLMAKDMEIKPNKVKQSVEKHQLSLQRQRH